MECHHNGYFQCSVNGMHDSTMPLSGMVEMLNMQINTWFGGVGVGWLNYYILYYHGRFYQRTDGGAYAGISGIRR